MSRYQVSNVCTSLRASITEIAGAVHPLFRQSVGLALHQVSAEGGEGHVGWGRLLLVLLVRKGEVRDECGSRHALHGAVVSEGGGGEVRQADAGQRQGCGRAQGSDGLL